MTITPTVPSFVCLDGLLYTIVYDCVVSPLKVLLCLVGEVYYPRVVRWRDLHHHSWHKAIDQLEGGVSCQCICAHVDGEFCHRQFHSPVLLVWSHCGP